MNVILLAAASVVFGCGSDGDGSTHVSRESLIGRYGATEWTEIDESRPSPVDLIAGGGSLSVELRADGWVEAIMERPLPAGGYAGSRQYGTWTLLPWGALITWHGVGWCAECAKDPVFTITCDWEVLMWLPDLVLAYSPTSLRAEGTFACRQVSVQLTLEDRDAMP
jgi:hypothetical protein